MTNKGSGGDSGGGLLQSICGTTRIAVMKIREGGDGGGRYTGRQQKRCGTTEMVFLGKLQWRRRIVEGM